MANPTIAELQNEEKFELIAELNHEQIKDFVINQLSGTSKIVRVYMIYQFLMLLGGMFFLARAAVLAFQNYLQPLYISLATLLFCFTFLIVFHELIHGIALKFTGAKAIRFGAYFKKFIFYAEADKHVLNRSQFAFVALAPLIFVQIITLFGILFFWKNPSVYFWIITMSTHSLFCAGDIGLLTIFFNDRRNEIYTFDIKEKKQSYYFRKK